MTTGTEIVEVEVREKITPEVQGKIQNLNTLLTQAEEIAVRDDETAEQATNLAGQLRDARLFFENSRKDWTADLVKAKKNIDNWFKRFTSQVDTVEPILDAKIRQYIREKQRKEEEKAREKQRLIDEALAKKRKEEEVQAKKEHREPEVIEPIKIEVQKVVIKTSTGRSFSTRLEWTFEVIDKSRVPAEYLEVDTVKVNQAIKIDGVREIPGLRIYQQDIGVRR